MAQSTAGAIAPVATPVGKRHAFVLSPGAAQPRDGVPNVRHHVGCKNVIVIKLFVLGEPRNADQKLIQVGKWGDADRSPNPFQPLDFHIRASK
jgi:hypothetical protein